MKLFWKIMRPVILSLLILVVVRWLNKLDDPLEIRSSVMASTPTITGFARATTPDSLNFPDDFGPHPEFQTEWWYYTGNLISQDGRHFGFQFTIFRRALLPINQLVVRNSKWGTNQIYMGHFAITDVKEKKHYAFERFARGSAGIASAEANPYRVWLEDWQAYETQPGSYRITAKQDGIEVDLVLEDLKGPILHGKDGYSQKGPDPGNASYYYSQTRLETEGSISINSQQYMVRGLSWKDHEYSTNALSDNQVGWDWFALQFSNYTELKVYNIRNADGTIDPFSNGSYVDEAGTVHNLRRDDFEIEVLGYWQSKESTATYPSGWKITVPRLELSLFVEPFVDAQELILSYTYWEGAVRVSGVSAGDDIHGNGYVELTGYAATMEGEF